MANFEGKAPALAVSALNSVRWCKQHERVSYNQTLNFL